jgi:peptidoglycan hydrolase CwlO-like protein
MKRLILLLVTMVFAMTLGSVWSADNPKKAADDKKEPAAKGTLPANWKKLGLTDDQVKKVYKAQSDYRNKIAVLEEQIKELKSKEKSEMEALLTDAQKARLREIKTGDGDKQP